MLEALLEGESLPRYVTDHKDSFFAHPRGGASKPGLRDQKCTIQPASMS